MNPLEAYLPGIYGPNDIRLPLRKVQSGSNPQPSESRSSVTVSTESRKSVTCPDQRAAQSELSVQVQSPACAGVPWGPLLILLALGRGTEFPGLAHVMVQYHVVTWNTTCSHS